MSYRSSLINAKESVTNAKSLPDGCGALSRGWILRPMRVPSIVLLPSRGNKSGQLMKLGFSSCDAPHTRKVRGPAVSLLPERGKTRLKNPSA